MEIYPVDKRKLAVRRLAKTYKVLFVNQKDYFPQKTKKRKCPIDNADMLLLNIEGTHIDLCPICYGIWFDPGELRELLKLDFNKIKLNDTQLLSELDNNASEIDFASKQCPACGSRLVKRNNKKAEIILDVCEECGGVWLDGGEFAIMYFKYQEQEISGSLYGVLGEIVNFYA